MPQFCPHCRAETADDADQCPHCGQPPIAGSLQDPQADSDRRFPFWTLLPWTLLAAALLFFLPHLRNSSAEKPDFTAAARLRAAPSAGPADDPAVPNSTAAPASPGGSSAASSAAVPITPAAVPLTVTLSSASGRKHVPVGKPVMISAYASLPPGQSATLAISYGREHGPKTLLALAQGSLSSAAWTPAAPGRYSFTASALDSRKNGAFSPRLVMVADAPPAPAPARPVLPITVAVPAPPVKPVPARQIMAAPALPKLVAPKPSAPKPRPKITAAPKPRPKIAAAPQPFHVAAASFPVKHIAETLAGALRQRGFHAFVRPGPHRQYRVETGDFMRRADADKQVQLLKHDGYPSYLFQTY